MSEEGTNKRGLADTETDPSEERSSRKILKTVKVIRVLCPNYAVGSILGKGGERLKQFKDATGAKITVSKQGQVFPMMGERYVSIMADLATLQKVVKFVQTRIREDEFKPKDDKEVSRFEKRKKVCKIIVSDNVIGKIIGKGGESINELKVKYDVMIKTSNKRELPHDLPERVIIIQGPDDKVDGCADEIIADIHEDPRSNLDFFVDYEKYLAHSASVPSSGGGRDRSPPRGYNPSLPPAGYGAHAGYPPGYGMPSYPAYNTSYSTGASYPQSSYGHGYPGYPPYYSSGSTSYGDTASKYYPPHYPSPSSRDYSSRDYPRSSDYSRSSDYPRSSSDYSRSSNSSFRTG